MLLNFKSLSKTLKKELSRTFIGNKHLHESGTFFFSGTEYQMFKKIKKVKFSNFKICFILEDKAVNQ